MSDRKGADVTVLNQLQLCKYLLQASRRHWHITDPRACGLAVSMAQDSVEMLVWTLAKEKDVSVREKESFTNLLDKIELHLKQSFPYKAKVLELNAIRVKFKHYGNLPLPEEALRLIGYGEDAVREGMRLFFSVELDTLSMADGIQNPAIRRIIKLAEADLKENALKECMEKCADANVIAVKPLATIFPLADYFRWRIRNIFEKDKVSDAETLFRDIASTLNRLRSASLSSLFNLNGRDHLRYESLMPITTHMANGSIQKIHRKLPYTEEDVQFCINYVTDLALKIQQWEQPNEVVHG